MTKGAANQIRLRNTALGNYLERDILENDDGVLGRVLFEQSLEVGGAGRQDHLVSLAGLSVASLEQKYKPLEALTNDITIFRQKCGVLELN